ncbi:MAG: MoaD/ThiS family protein [Candidatus Hydrothermarchaeota archaeon]|nr:MoaD/ThiS family protein [Candidatus Hydrothermarchaeota archaeon]
MKIKVKLNNKKSEVEVANGSTVDELLEKLGINRETVLVRRNKEICLEEELLKPNDFVEIIKVVSGG